MKKKLIFTIVFIFLLCLLVVLSHILYTSFMNKISFESYITNIKSKNSSSVFTIDKIALFSSCSSDSNINSNNTTTISNLWQYTDIAIFLNSSTEDELSFKNTLKSVSIKDISFNVSPSLGVPNLYYKCLTDFATTRFQETNLINSDLDFSISSDEQIDFSKPVLFNNCANPITLSYINSNIIDKYTVENTENSIIYDGSLLKKCNILLDDLNCKLSFTIYIENNLGEKFKCPVYITIPLENSSSSIYDGSYTYIYNPNYTFFRYE